MTILVLLSTICLSAQEWTVERAPFSTAQNEYAPFPVQDGVVFVSHQRSAMLSSYRDLNGEHTSGWMKVNWNEKNAEPFALEIQSA
ncbi:MAG: hypothetical protein AAF193_07000, partial [Bacteroidota bacterium]